MEHIDHARKFHRVDCAIGVSIEVIHDLKDGGAAEALQGLGEGRLETTLSVPDRTPEPPLDILRKTLEILPRAADPSNRLRSGGPPPKPHGRDLLKYA